MSNQAICIVFENFIKDMGGTSDYSVSGNSFVFKGSVSSPKTATITLKSTTIDTAASILGYGKTVENSKMEIRGLELHEVEFQVRKQGMMDRVNILAKEIPDAENYTLITDKKEVDRVIEFLRLFQPHMASGALKFIRYEKERDMLQFELDTLEDSTSFYEDIIRF